MIEEKNFSKEYLESCAEMRETYKFCEEQYETNPEVRAWIEKMRKFAVEIHPQ